MSEYNNRDKAGMALMIPILISLICLAPVVLFVALVVSCILIMTGLFMPVFIVLSIYWIIRSGDGK